MKLKKLHSTFLFTAIVAGNIASAQLVIDNATFTIQAGAVVTVQGDVTSNTDISGTGVLLMKGGTLTMTNGAAIPKLEIDNGANVTLGGNAKINVNLLFTNGNLILGNNDLVLAATATITNSSSTKFIVTNGTGKLIKSALDATAFSYPVGNSVTNYNPVSISNAGTSDDIGVRSIGNVLANGLTGAAFTKEVVNSWDITEAIAGGSNLSVTASWNGSDELPGFDRTRGGLSFYITSPAANVGWDLLNNQTAVATGNNPYTYTRTGITTLGTFAVGTRPVLSPLLASPKIFLQGAYNTSNGVMNDNLRTANLIPISEPYSPTGFISAALRGSGGGETSASNIVGLAAGSSTNSSIVDWVLAQLHDAAGTVITQRAVLLRRDGAIVETDGVSPVNFAGNATGGYFISIRHRNHLGVRTLNTLPLAKVTSAIYDFTPSLSQTFPGAVANNAMVTLSPGLFGLWGGNANDDAVVKMTGLNANNNDYLKLINILGSSTAAQTGVYSKQDLNMDGTVKMTGLNANNNDYLKLLNILGSSTASVSQPTF